MTLTAPDDATALVVIDLQRGMAALDYPEPFDLLVARCNELANVFRTAGAPVVLVNTNGAAPGRRERRPFSGEQPANWAELLPALAVRADDHRVTKGTPGAFTNTQLDGWLRAKGMTQVVICGVATGTGVETTARQAYELGYNVAVAVDAVADMDAAVQANSIARTLPRVAETGTTAGIATLVRGEVR